MSEPRTILIVDDEPAIRQLIAIVVRGLGYGVLEAQNGLEAVQVCGSYRSEIALVITDVNMPVMDGLEALSRIKGMCPELRVVVMSGGGGELPPLPRGCSFLRKPFTMDVLAESVREALH